MRTSWTENTAASTRSDRELNDSGSQVSGITYDASSANHTHGQSSRGTPRDSTTALFHDESSNDMKPRTSLVSVDGNEEEEGEPLAIEPRCSTRSSSRSILKDKTKDFTINHLRYNRVQLHGREEELKQIIAAFQNSTQHCQKHLVALEGQDIGSGVTYLTKQFYKHVHVRYPCFYMGGKYDHQTEYNVPYAGFALACEKFYASLLKLKVELIPQEEDDDDRNLTIDEDIDEDGHQDSYKSGYRQSVTPAFMGPTGARRQSQFFFSYDDLVSKVRDTLDIEEKRVLAQTLPTIQELLIVPTTNIDHSSSSNTNGHADKAAKDDRDRNRNDSSSSNNNGRDQEDDVSATSNSTVTFDRKSTNEHDYSQQKIQFHQAFQKFLRTIASFAPVILALDDFQYADPASVELLRDILTDHKNQSGITIIAAYQENLLEADHPFREALEDLQHDYGNSDTNDSKEEDTSTDDTSKNETNATVVTIIPIQNLTIRSIQGILNDLMNEDDNESPRMMELAEVVHRKTLGNPLFAIQFLKSLVDAEVLEFQFERFSWDWDIEVIRKRTNVTENVLDLMVQKLRILPSHISRTLPMIASLGFSFPQRSLQIVLDFDLDRQIKMKRKQNKDESEGESETTGSSTISALTPEKYVKECIDEGILEAFGEGWYRWAHDKLMEAAVSLAEPQELEKLQYMIGLKLFKEYTPDELERNLFVVASLLNMGNASNACKESGLTSLEQDLQIAQINLRAGKKAIGSSLFQRSVTYLNQGIALLPHDHWKSHYDLSLELFSVAAQAEYITGDFENMARHCDAVIAQDRPLLDKRRVYNAMMDSMGAQDRMGDAAKLCVEVLAKLGCRFPSYGAPLYTIGGLIGTVMAKKKRKTGMIGQYKTLTDPAKIWAMNLLDQLFTFWYQDKNPNVPLAILKSQSWTIKYGVCDVSMPNFASVGFMLGAFLGDYEGGEIYAKHALELLEKSGSEAIRSRTLLVAYGSNLHWRIPFHDCVKPMLEGYNVGMKMGDVESGLYCILFYLWFSFLLGTPLAFVASDLDTYSKQMMKFQQKKHLFWTQITLQVDLNLMGAKGNENKYRIVGEIMDEDNLALVGDDIHILKPALHMFQIYAMFYFCEYEKIVDIIEAHEDGYFEKAIPGISMLMVNAFQSAIACIHMARKTGKSKYKKMAQKFKAKIDGWVKKGNPNVLRYQALVDAEWLTLSGAKKKHEALSKYEVAILMSGRRGLSHDQAVAHLLCSEFHYSLDNRSDGVHHAEQAVKLYEEWGAMAVAAQLREGKNLFLPPTEIRSSKYGSNKKHVKFGDAIIPRSSRTSSAPMSSLFFETSAR